jgi:hypothetical protein
MRQQGRADPVQLCSKQLGRLLVAATLLAPVGCPDGGGGGGSGSPTATGTDSGTTGPGTDSGSGSGGVPPGPCPKECDVAADCCPVDAPPNGFVGSCPSDTYPTNWSCVGGQCVNEGCLSDADCVFPNHTCHAVGGVGFCFEPCLSDIECETTLNMPGTSCVGSTDDGSFFCQ